MSASYPHLSCACDDDTITLSNSKVEPTYYAPEFLKKVVPDWNVSFSRSDSTASTQSKRLSDIGAKIKKTGKGYVVRLLKRSAADTDQIAEVDLGQHALTKQDLLEQALTGSVSETHELGDTCKPADLYAPPVPLSDTDIEHHSFPETEPNSGSQLPRTDVFEIGTSNEDGVQRPQQSSTPMQALPDVPSPKDLTYNNVVRNSIAEDSLSDAETLIPEVRIYNEQTDFERFFGNTSVVPTRSASISSIVKTPTRGLSIRAVHKRVEKRPRYNTTGFERKTPVANEYPQAKSAQVSPIARRRKSPRIRKPISSSASPTDPEDVVVRSSPEWTEVNHSDELREALKKVLGSTVPKFEDGHAEGITPKQILPEIIGPVDNEQIGEIPLPSEV
ncbi:hypothetical protein CFE70_004560 [Pyrenophora teres f. teres 0-1]